MDEGKMKELDEVEVNYDVSENDEDIIVKFIT